MCVLHMGEFDSEKYWRSPEYTNLPYIKDPQAYQIIRSMDEMLFVFCKQEDLLITRHHLHPKFKAYLNEIGYRFLSNDSDVISSKQTDIFTEIIERKNEQWAMALISKGKGFSFYSILDSTQQMLIHYQREDIKVLMPEIVKKVNSKIFSYQLNRNFGFENGEMIDSIHQLREIGKAYLLKGDMLVKDPYGVAGKGNLLIRSERMLERLIKHLEKQTNVGKQMEFLIEPYMNKTVDFSCQAYIDQNGNYQFYGLQILQNKGQSFGYVMNASKDFYEFVSRKGYFTYIEKAIYTLIEEGYRGNVCFDSMIVNHHQIIPIIEINARKSMGNINHAVYNKFKYKGLKTKVGFMNLLIPKKIDFESLLSFLEKEKILFYPKTGVGIVPLSSNCFEINAKQLTYQEDIYKGRLYYCICTNKQEQEDYFEEKLKECFSQMGVKKI